jgi:hypothetical protein
MNRINRLSLVLSLAILCSLGFGCSSIQPTDTVKDAIDRGLVSGLSISNQLTAVEWSYPPSAYLPYSEVRNLSLTVPNPPANTNYYAFYIGKSITSKKWEIVSVQKWESLRHRWEPVTLKSPEAKSGE